jgi:hypothetical protein
MNNQSPINHQLITNDRITNTQTELSFSFFTLYFGFWLLGIIWLLVFGYW